MRRSKNPLARKLAKFCRAYLNYYNDYSYDFYKNGEEDLLRKLSPLNFGTVFDVGSNLGEWAKIGNHISKIQKFIVLKFLQRLNL